MKYKTFLVASSVLVFGCIPPLAAPDGFKFQHCFMDRQLPGDSWAQTALADVDKDGRLDYITGQTRGPIFWYRQEAPDRWIRHTLGTNSPSDVGGVALDVDGDGWLDFVAGGAWYRNTGRPRTEPFERVVFDQNLAAVHDLAVADVDRDGRPDILTMSDRNNLRWYRIPRDPRQAWERHDIGPGVHAGIGVGDLDGDGDLDVARSNLWFENADGKGTRWVTHENIPFGNPNQPYPLGTHCVALDLDRDGDQDLVMTENEIKDGRIGWLENLNGKGGGWRLHELPRGDNVARGAYHSLLVADFDNDGDSDVFSCEMEGIPGDRSPRWFIWENTDGKGGRFIEHVILDANLGGHLVVAGDVDGDGDLDLVGKLWRPRKDNANEGRNHVDLLENRLVAPSLQRVRVSDNQRFLVTENGQPFFWLGDTSWHMFGKSAREEAANQPPVSRYFASRAAKGFTVIQSVIVRSPDGGSSANAYGFEPFESGDWARPRVRPGPNDDYWDHVDWCVAEAKRNKLYLAALPCWLSTIEDNNPMVRDPRVAYRYGHFLGTRYGKEPHLIWVLGGDAWQKGRNVDQPVRLALVRAQAEGIADAVNGVDQFDGQADWRTTLMTFHPPGGDHSSSEWLHSEPWLDFNMIQTTTRFNFENWRTVAKDYALPPPKPTFDAEVAYEDSLSLRQTEPQDRRIQPWDARRAAYWNVFAGGLGHTYGHRSFIGWIRKDETYRYGAHIPWYASLDAPGAFQMGHLRRLMESRPFLTRVPDQSIIASDTLTGDEHLQATRDSGGTYAMVYSPSGRPFQVRMDSIAGAKMKAWWFNPRTGQATALGEFANTGEREFTPPTSGEDNDWVLALDDAAKNLRAPGLVKDTRSFVQPGTSAGRFKAISVGTRPESVTKGFGGHYYVTVMGDSQPGDAVIKVIRGGQVEVFATGMDEPKGIAFVGGFLVTTDVKRVWKIDARGNKTVLAEEKDFPKPISYLNDTAAGPDGHGVFVTDMGARDKIMGPDGLWPLDSPEARALPHLGRIYHITLDGQVRLAVNATPEMACPNGVCAPALDRLLIAEFFHGNLLQARGGKVEQLNTGFRGADGIECAKSGEIFVSSWTQGMVWKLDQHGQNPKVLVEGLQSAADFYLDERARLLLVPDMKAGTIVYVPLE